MAISHKRDANARPKPKVALVAGPLAFLVTSAVVTLGVVGAEPEAFDVITASGATGAVADISGRGETVSRADSRRERVELQRAFDVNMSRVATQRAINRADTRLWATAPLNLWTSGDRKAKKVGEIKSGKRVLVTGRHGGGRDEIVLDGKSRWVTSGYLADEKPVLGPVGIGGACTNGSSVSSGVSANIASVHSAVCAAFPEITSYGDFRGDGEHSQGIAVDIMTSGARGWQVAEFVRDNYAALGVSYIIYSQNIWSVDRAGEGWRPMSDRGSTTANHYDHVHVTTY